MTIHGFDTSSAPLAIIGNQAKTWGARSVSALSSNPVLTIVSLIAIAALGAVIYLFNRVRVSDQKFEELNNKFELLNSAQKAKTETSGQPMSSQDKMDLMEAQKNILSLQNQLIEMTKNLALLTTLQAEIKNIKEQALPTLDSTLSKTLDFHKKLEKSIAAIKENFEQAIVKIAQDMAQGNESLKSKLGADLTTVKKALEDLLDDAVSKLINKDNSLERELEELKDKLESLNDLLGSVETKLAGLKTNQEQIGNLPERVDLNIVAFSKLEAKVTNELKAIKVSLEALTLSNDVSVSTTKDPLRKRSNSTPVKSEISPSIEVVDFEKEKLPKDLKELGTKPSVIDTIRKRMQVESPKRITKTTVNVVDTVKKNLFISDASKDKPSNDKDAIKRVLFPDTSNVNEQPKVEPKVESKEVGIDSKAQNRMHNRKDGNITSFVGMNSRFGRVDDF